MKILFIYRFLGLGGVETVLRNRYEGFQSLRIKIDFVFLEDHGGRSSFKNLDNAETYVTNDMEEVKQIIDKGDYDLISVIDTPEVHKLLKEIAKERKVVMEVHTPHPLLRKYIKTDILEDAVAVIVPTKTFGKLVESEMKKPHPPIIAMPNPINKKFFYEYENIPKHSRIPIAYVGRIEDIKDWRESVKILKLVARKFKNIDFFMVGKLVEEKPKNIFDEFSAKGLTDHFKWIPFIEYDKMPLFYNFIAKNNGVYLSSSKGESFGMTLIESMACKLPVVVYDLPVFREVLERGNLGKIYRTVEEASESILLLIENRQKREALVEKAYHKVMDSYTPKVFAEKWLEL